MRDNRFYCQYITDDERRNISGEKAKILYIYRIDTNETKEMETSMNITVTQLKGEIERMFGLDKDSLEKISLRVEKNGRNEPVLIYPNMEEKTLSDLHIKSYNKIIFGAVEVYGGQINKN